MFIPVIAGLAGAWLASRGKPNSDIKKRECLGPKSGTTYLVDEVPASGIVLVHAHSSVGVFQRKKDGPGFSWVKGEGHPEVLAMMIRDFIDPKPKPEKKEPSP